MDNDTQLVNTPVVLVFISVFLVCYYFLTKRRNLPPGPLCLPFVGSVFFAIKIAKSKKRMARMLFEEETKKYGDVIQVQLGSQKIVFLHGYKAIQEAFVKNAGVLSDRPHWLPNLKEGTKEGKGIIWQSGTHWKILRKFALQTLRDFGVGKTSLEEKIFAEIDAATACFAVSDGKPTNVRHLASMMISNIIYGIVFNKRFDYSDSEFHQIIEKLDLLFARNGGGAGTQLPPAILKVIDNETYKRNRKRLETLKWIKNHIYEEIHRHEATFDKANIRDFVDLYLESKGVDDTENEIFTVGNMFRMIMDLFIAGSETTSNTINWCILYMMEYPDVQKKCQDDILEKYGDRPITWSHKGTLPYVEATLLEIQRMANIAEMSLPHTSEVDTTIQGYVIPKRTVVQANLYSANMDPTQWDQPEKFNPGRFLENGKLKKNPALMPFSIGPRICMGESLAKMEMFLIFSNFLQRFTFKREDDEIKHTFECVLVQLTSAPVEYKTRAIRRT